MKTKLEIGTTFALCQYLVYNELFMDGKKKIALPLLCYCGNLDVIAGYDKCGGCLQDSRCLLTGRTLSRQDRNQPFLTNHLRFIVPEMAQLFPGGLLFTTRNSSGRRHSIFHIGGPMWQWNERGYGKNVWNVKRVGWIKFAENVSIHLRSHFADIRSNKLF